MYLAKALLMSTHNACFHRKFEKKKKKKKCIINLKYLDRQAWANNVDPDLSWQKAVSDQGLHCIPIQHKLLIN